MFEKLWTKLSCEKNDYFWFSIQFHWKKALPLSIILFIHYICIVLCSPKAIISYTYVLWNKTFDKGNTN